MHSKVIKKERIKKGNCLRVYRARSVLMGSSKCDNYITGFHIKRIKKGNFGFFCLRLKSEVVITDN